MKVPFLDLAIKDADFRAELLDAVDGVLRHGRFIMGPEHDRFEDAIADYCGRRHCVGVGSGSDALYLTLRALDIGPGDEVITTPLTWVATTNAIVLTGATPVFVDIADDLNIDAGRIEAAVTERTKAILPVHFTGQMCDVDAIAAIAERHGLHLVEDAAQAFGAAYKDRKAGAFGVASCFSINPMKVFNGFGEAGAVTTDDAALADRLRALRYAGTINKEDCHWPSINGRLDTVQAAMLLKNLPRVAGKIEARRRVAARYRDRLDGAVVCPVEKPGHYHSYYSFTVLADHRDALRDHLANHGVETKVMHPILMPYHTAYKGRFDADIPNAEALVAKILCLPAHEDMTGEAVDYVAQCIKDFRPSAD